MSNFKTVIADYSSRFNEHLSAFFNVPKAEEKQAVEAMLYSLTNGGKRLRPFLVFEVAKMFGRSFEQSLNVAVSVECLHTYSLIHDDLPAMDNDDLRRGKPTCHKQFDDATAILAGDGLLTYAFGLLAQELHCSRLVSLLARAAGAFEGMVAGQMLDLLAEKGLENSEELIKRIEEMKTGRLISYAVQAGAVLGEANLAELKALVEYARGIGMAFQISDDILDVEGNQELMGKTLGKDIKAGKATFVSFYGVETARKMAQDLIEKAKESLNIFGDRAVNLKLLANYIIEREN